MKATESRTTEKVVPVDTNCLKRTCPICQVAKSNVYGPISAKLGCCSKDCSDYWDTFTFAQKDEWTTLSREQKVALLLEIRASKGWTKPIPNVGYLSAIAAA